MTDFEQEDAERRRRRFPGTDPPPEGALLPKLPEPKLIAPNARGNPKDRNTLHLAAWVQVRVVVASVNEDGAPIKGPVPHERCHLFAANGTILEGETDDDGVVTFHEVPIFSEARVPPEDVFEPAFVLPDILEEWVNPRGSPGHFEDTGDPPGVFGKHFGERDDHRKGDGMVRFVRAFVERFEVAVERLTPEQKLQHFRHAFEAHGAQYATASPGEYDESAKRFSWGLGSVCNQHVNFFLSYWYNLGEKFTPSGSGTTMATLCTFDAAVHDFGPEKPGGRARQHRGFSEFLQRVSAPVASTSKVWRGQPTEQHTDGHYKRNVEYIHLGAKYFSRSGVRKHYSYAPTAAGKALIASLGDVNVYSLSNIQNWGKSQVPNARAEIASWAKRHPKNKHGATEESAAKMNDHATEDFIWHLDDDDPDDAALVAALRSSGNIVGWDHHAGILLKRGPNGRDPHAPAEDEGAHAESELWYFPADGTHESPKPIVMKSMTDRARPVSHDLMLDGVFTHVAIWKLLPLREGGFAPTELFQNAGDLDIDAPPRFVHWSGGAAPPHTKRKHEKAK